MILGPYMSYGFLHDQEVMINHRFIKDWDAQDARIKEVNCLSLVQDVPVNHANDRDRNQILTGIKFGVQHGQHFHRIQRSSLKQSGSRKVHQHQNDECEPLWVTISASLGLALGLLSFWILL